MHGRLEKELPAEGFDTAGWLAVFARGPDGALGYVRQVGPGRTWASWEALGPAIVGDPSVFQNGDGRLEVFAAGPDGLLGHVWQLEANGDSGWWDWEIVGPAVSGELVAVENADGRHEVFGIGPEGLLGHVWQWHHTGYSGWAEWDDFGIGIASAPSLFKNADGRLELFAAAPDGLLGHAWQLRPSGYTGWEGWDSFGVAISSAPVAVQNADGRLEVFAAGPDGALGHVWQHVPSGHGGWAPWDSFGAVISSAPSVVQNADGRLELFAVGADGTLGHVWQIGPRGHGGWEGWDSFDIAISSAPTVVRTADGRLEVFAAGPDGVLGHVWQLEPNGHAGWSAWEELGPVLPGRRLAVCLADTPAGSKPAAPAPAGGRRSATRRSRTLEADVCVIGAGPAGITVSEGLVRAGANVVLAESGTLEQDPAAQELNNGFAEGQILRDYWRYLRNGRRRGVQGSAVVWGRGWCLPFRALDFEHRPWIALSGWPLSAADLAPYEAKAAATFAFDTFEPPRPDGELVQLSYHYPPDPFVFRSNFANLLEGPRFHAELGATAVELAVRGERIESVRLALSDGGELRVAADKVVLAAGAIENARLLLLHEGALQMSEMLGRCFMEHPHVVAGSVKLPVSTPLRGCIEDGPKRDVLALDDDAQHRGRLLNATVQLRPRPRPAGSEGPLQCDLYLRAEQAPNTESRVFLGDRLDRLGLPWPVLHWELLERDWQSVVHSVELVAAALQDGHDAVVKQTIGWEMPWPGIPAAPPESPDATWGFHHLGTTRMALRPDEGVVDPNCLVHGTENLYVAGSSVFPTGGAANPTFTIVAMAHRLADHLSA